MPERVIVFWLIRHQPSGRWFNTKTGQLELSVGHATGYSQDEKDAEGALPADFQWVRFTAVDRQPDELQAAPVHVPITGHDHTRRPRPCMTCGAAGPHDCRDYLTPNGQTGE